jgi:small multidrug resistance pump
MALLYITCAFLFNAIANILFKFGAKKGFVFHGLNLSSLTDNALFLLGFVFFGLNALFYFIALHNLPLSIAYPIMVGMSLLIINTFAFIYLGEQITVLQIVGYLFLILGILIIFTFASHK